MEPGTTARSRPTSAAAGAPSGERDMLWSRLVPSTRSRDVLASGLRSGAGIEAIVRATGRAATIGCVSLLLLVDLDGVVYRGADPVPGVAAVLADRVARGDDVVYVTNNSMHYRADYQTRLAAMGAPVTPATVVSSARATAVYLKEHDPQIRRVLVLGAGGLERELRDEGYDVVAASHVATRVSQEGIDGFDAAGRPDAVVVGLDPYLTYVRLAVAADCVRAGAQFIATNRDPVYPTERGLRPGAGSIVAAVEATTGVVPISIGKPAPHLLEAAAHAVGRQAAEAIMIGDGIGTDLAAARAVGARCVFMLTGVTSRSQLEALPVDEQPTAVAADADELAAALNRLAS
jgi:HAD superfamily hydrolase (TIGR01450 family)